MRDHGRYTRQALLLAVAVCAPAWAQQGEVVPVRGADHGVPAPLLWQKLAEQPHPGEAILGLKAPQARRGIWRGQILLSRPEVSADLEALSAVPGIKVLGPDHLLPAARVRFDNLVALTAARELGFVDYIQPASWRVSFSSEGGSGCDQVNYENAPLPGPAKGNFTVHSVTGGSAEYAGYYDYVPWNFTDLAQNAALLNFTLFNPNFHGHRIPQAWRRNGGGENTTVGIADTGVNYFSTMDFYLFGYGKYSQRTFDDEQAWLDDPCGHGTRAATTALSPMNDTDSSHTLVGVAWAANGRAAYVGPDPWLSFDDYWDAGDAMDQIACNSNTPECTTPVSPRTIVSMAFGDNAYDPITDGFYFRDRIAYWDDHGVLFLGASGTNFCAFLSDDAPDYPASLPEVIEVGCLNPATGTRSIASNGDKACRSEQLAGIWVPDVPAGGFNSGDIWAFGGSSACVSTVSGIAALTWAAHPEWSKDDVISRLQHSGHLYPSIDYNLGYGVVDAFKAVGGLGEATVNAPATAPKGTQFDVYPWISYGDGPLRYEYTDGDCNGECRWNGTSCTGSCSLVGSCVGGGQVPHCSGITRTASSTVGGLVKTKLTVFDEGSRDTSDEIAMRSGGVVTTCATGCPAGNLGDSCGGVADGCGGSLTCGCGAGLACYQGHCCTDPCYNKECGSYSNGCGANINCGTCDTGERCTRGLCQPY